MNTLSIAIAYLRHQWSSHLLHIITFACGVAMIIAILLINTQMQDEFNRNLRGIDLVVGAKGSPLQLILSSVFHIDIPTGNIPLDEAEKLKHHPMVKAAIPLAMGDNYNGFRIVGTEPSYIAHYGGILTPEGRLWNAPMEAIIGSDVQNKYHLKLGDKIVGAHGLANSDDLHEDFPYTVVGFLNPTHSVLDRLVLTPVESVWRVHEHPDEDDPEEVAYKKEHPGNELTALLLQYKSPLAAASLPREVNKSTSMQAASPAFEVARLTRFMGVGAETLRAIALVLVALSFASIFVTLYSAVHKRRYDIAVLRSFGAPRRKILQLVLSESLLISVCAIALGWGAGHILVSIIGVQSQHTTGIGFSGLMLAPDECTLLLTCLAVGLIAAILPARKAYNSDIATILTR